MEQIRRPSRVSWRSRIQVQYIISIQLRSRSPFNPSSCFKKNVSRFQAFLFWNREPFFTLTTRAGEVCFQTPQIQQCSLQWYFFYQQNYSVLRKPNSMFVFVIQIHDFWCLVHNFMEKNLLVSRKITAFVKVFRFVYFSNFIFLVRSLNQECHGICRGFPHIWKSTIANVCSGSGFDKHAIPMLLILLLIGAIN